MNLEKKITIIATIGFIFFIIFILSAFLVLTNTLNMWLVGIISFCISLSCYSCVKNMKN